MQQSLMCQRACFVFVMVSRVSYKKERFSKDRKRTKLQNSITTSAKTQLGQLFLVGISDLPPFFFKSPRRFRTHESRHPPHQARRSQRFSQGSPRVVVRGPDGTVTQSQKKTREQRVFHVPRRNRKMVPGWLCLMNNT